MVGHHKPTLVLSLLTLTARRIRAETLPGPGYAAIAGIASSRVGRWRTTMLGCQGFAVLPSSMPNTAQRKLRAPHAYRELCQRAKGQA
jgi:hypothetical protein